MTKLAVAVAVLASAAGQVTAADLPVRKPVVVIESDATRIVHGVGFTLVLHADAPVNPFFPRKPGATSAAELAGITVLPAEQDDWQTTMTVSQSRNAWAPQLLATSPELSVTRSAVSETETEAQSATAAVDVRQRETEASAPTIMSADLGDGPATARLLSAATGLAQAARTVIDAVSGAQNAASQ
ncbi:MAG: hypothetical protein AAGF32_00530 [Pseudomonadota bacterium]